MDGLELQVKGLIDSKFGLMQDEEVVSLAKRGHAGAAEFLITRYRPLVESKAKSYFVVGADREDVIQEGMIGLYKAIRDFRNDRLGKFRPFAELCVTRQIITAVKTATRHKHAPLNAYVSLNRSSDGPQDPSLLEVLCDPAHSQAAEDPAGTVRNLEDELRGTLSELELCVLRCYLQGMSYREMSRELECHTKSVDNALQRVKRKIGSLVEHDSVDFLPSAIRN